MLWFIWGFAVRCLELISARIQCLTASKELSVLRELPGAVTSTRLTASAHKGFIKTARDGPQMIDIPLRNPLKSGPRGSLDSPVFDYTNLFFKSFQ